MEYASDNARHVGRYYESVDAGDLVAVVDCFADDATYRRPGYLPIVGKVALREFYGKSRVIADGRHEIVWIVEEGPYVAVRGKFDGTLRDGTVTSAEFADFFLVNDGKIGERYTYFAAPLI